MEQGFYTVCCQECCLEHVYGHLLMFTDRQAGKSLLCSFKGWMVRAVGTPHTHLFLALPPEPLLHRQHPAEERLDQIINLKCVIMGNVKAFTNNLNNQFLPIFCTIKFNISVTMHEHLIPAILHASAYDIQH